MRIKMFLIGVLCLGYSAYSRIDITYRGLGVSYQIFRPLRVEVETPEKIRVKSGRDSFRYGDTNQGRFPLKVEVVTPRASVGGIYDSAVRDHRTLINIFYGRVKLSLANQGNFELKEIKDTSKVIKGRGFFVAEGGNAYEMVLQLNSRSYLAQEEWAGKTSIDVMFNEEGNEILMGVYKGVLKLDATYM